MLPQLVWHRQDWSILRPYISLREGGDSVQAQELNSAGVFCAGFVDSSILMNDEHFDVIVNLPASTINVLNHCRADFKMGSIHKVQCLVSRFCFLIVWFLLFPSFIAYALCVVYYGTSFLFF